MTGAGRVSDLAGMLAGLAPALDPHPYRYLSLPPGEDPHAAWLGEPFAIVREDEGATVIAVARDPEPGGVLFARVTLQIHSDLEGVGLTAAVSSALTGAGIACNVIAGFHHDHLFVPWDRREESLKILIQLSQDARR